MRKVLGITKRTITKCKKRAAGIIALIILFTSIRINLGVDVVKAATLNIPNTQFITKEEIIKLCNDTNNGDGLLATGTNTDVELKINFGYRPDKIYYYASNEEEMYSTESDIGVIPWYIAGNEDNNKLVLYAKEPLISVNSLDSSSNSIYEKRQIKVPYVYNYNAFVSPDNGVYAADVTIPTKILSNHWGASSIRKVGSNIYYSQGAYAGKEFFNVKEKELMLSSSIVTLDILNNENYTTEDILYLPLSKEYEDKMYVGYDDSITIDIGHIGPVSWLRNPSKYAHTDNKYLGQYAVATLQGRTNIYGTDHKNITFAPAFALDSSQLKFAAVGDGTATSSFTKLEKDAAMYLRMGEDFAGYPFVEKHKVSSKGSVVNYSAPKDSYLMILALDRKGNIYQYAKPIEENVTNQEINISNIPGLTKGIDYSAKVWIEKKAGGSLAYATDPIDIYNIKSWGAISDERVDNVVQYVDREGKTSVEIKTENIKDDVIWLKEESDENTSWCGIEIPEDDIDVDKGLRFCIKRLSPNESDYKEVFDRLSEEQKKKVKKNGGLIFKISVEDTEGNPVQLTKPIKLFIQMEERWMAEGLEAYLVSEDKNESVPIDIGNLDDPESRDSFAIMLVDYFTPLVVYPSKLVEEEDPNKDNNTITDKEDGAGNNLDKNKDKNNTDSNLENMGRVPNTGDKHIIKDLYIYGIQAILSMIIILALLWYKKYFKAKCIGK